MEHFDLLSESGELTGERKLRTEVHWDGDWHKTVHVWFINNRHELLLQKRAAVKDSYPGMWDTSVAGHVEVGCDASRTVIKEAREEIGVSLRSEDVEYLFTITQKKVLKGGKFIDNEFNDVYLVQTDIDLETIELQAEEVAEVAWVPFTELEIRVSQRDATIVPHDDEYPKLFSILHQRFDMFDTVL